ncbi:MAG: cupin domain-containing protein [Flavobacteriales bacterium]
MKIASFLKNVTFNENKPSISMLLDTEFSKEIQIVFENEQIMKSHKAPFPITVQVLEGSINFGVNGEIKELQTGDLIYLDANIVHNLTALSQSVVRLTLSKLDTLQRVKSL